MRVTVAAAKVVAVVAVAAAVSIYPVVASEAVAERAPLKLAIPTPFDVQTVLVRQLYWL